MKKPILSIMVAASILLAATPPRAHSIALDLITPQDVSQGSLVDVALRISGLGNSTAPSLSTFDVDVIFDPTILSFSSAAFGDPVLGDQLDILDLGGNPMSSGLIGQGTLNVFESSLDTAADLDANQAPDFTLVTLTFEALSLGSSALELSINSLGDALGDSISASVEDGNITVVPIPATMWLLGAALVGILGLSGRRKSQYSA